MTELVKSAAVLGLGAVLAGAGLQAATQQTGRTLPNWLHLFLVGATSYLLVEGLEHFVLDKELVSDETHRVTG